MPDPFVELVGVSKRFGALEAVADVSLSVAEGQVTTLLGPSGCGKTTLLRLIAGFMRPDRGEIRIRGRSVNDLAPQRRSTAIVFQDYALFPHLTVFENVAYGLRRRRVPRSEIARRVGAMLAFLGLGGQESVPPLRLSGGQQQRVALARALVVEPDVLLLDEPLSNLDAKLRVRVRTELREIQRSLGKTTILVTHDQEEALSISDRVAVMEAGRIRQVGTPREIYSRPADRFVADFVGVANFVAATVRAVVDGHVHLDSVLGPLEVPATGPWAAGQSVTMMLRPSALSLSTVAGDGIPARIQGTSFLGEVQRHSVAMGHSVATGQSVATESLRLVVDRPVRTGEDLGERSWLSVDPTGVHLLPAEG